MGTIIGYVLFAGSGLGAYLYVRKQKNARCKNYLLALVIIGVICLLAAGWETFFDTSREISALKRNEAGKGTQEIELKLDAEELLEEYEYVISIEEQRVTEEQVQLIFEKAQQELQTVILGENPSVEEISSDLYVPNQLLDGLVDVICYFEPNDLIDIDGTIRWEKQKEESTPVKVTAELTCQEQQAVCEFYIQVVQRPLDSMEVLLSEIDERIKTQNQNQGQDYISLPKEINGIRLKWYESKEQIHIKILLAGIAGIIIWYIYQKEKRESEQKKRNQKLIMDYPDIVSRLSLLSGAGMTMSAAWTKIALEYRKAKEKPGASLRPGYEELLKTWYEMQDGLGEAKAYENFGNRCNLSQYRKFASMLIQNVRKGTKGMQQLLDAEVHEAFQQRKAYARQLGEEAGTKLLIPMGIMLVLVFAILLLPAMLSMSI